MGQPGFFRDRRHARLLARAKAGDSGAFRRLYRELYGPVARYVKSRVGSPDDGEDLTAKVFHRFLQHLDRFDPGKGSVVVWTMAMARNAVIDYHRCRRETLPIEELAEILAGNSPDPLDEILRDEHAQAVWELLRGLPAETREMFSLRYADGYTSKEIAALTGATEDAVKQRFSRALRLLREEVVKNPNQGGEVDYAV